MTQHSLSGNGTVASALYRAAALGGVAKSAAQLKSARDENARIKAHRHLVERLGKLRGIPRKIGQILSLSDLENEENPYLPLTEGEAILSKGEAIEEIERLLGRRLDTVFREFDGKGISASLAQVHRAVLHDGTPVAVKFLYPKIEDALWLDLKALGWLSLPFGGLKKKGFDLQGYQQTVKAILQEEMNYSQERRRTERFHAFTASHSGWQTPSTIPHLCGPRILTMTWIEGEDFNRVLMWPLKDREEIARQLIELFLRSLFDLKCLHGDPHPGNYRFIRNDSGVQIGLLDFGCVKEISSKSADALGWLFKGAACGKLQDNSDGCLQALVRLGFNPDLTEPMRDRLPQAISHILSPFMSQGAFDMKTWNLAEDIENTLGELRMNFRLAGPPDLLLFIRAYQGLVQYVKALNVKVNWRNLAQQVMDGRTIRSNSFSTPTPVPTDTTEARHLRILVTENGSEKAQITFRAIAAENLRDLMPDDLIPKLEERDIDIDRISKEARDSGYTRGVLFELEESLKRIRVWLE